MKINKQITILDIIFIIIASSIILFISLNKTGGDSSYIKVEADGETYKYSLSQNQKIIIEGAIGELTLEIENNSAKIIKSSCKNQICVNMGKIENEGEFIACIPNKVIVLILSDEMEVDDVAR